MKISVERSKCAGHALCYARGGELFPLDDEGYTTLQPSVVDERDAQRVRDAVASCPEGALSVSDED